jgi:hypothetical protein
MSRVAIVFGQYVGVFAIMSTTTGATSHAPNSDAIKDLTTKIQKEKLVLDGYYY